MKPNALFLKVAAVTVIVFLLMLALGQITYLASERQGRFH